MINVWKSENILENSELGKIRIENWAKSDDDRFFLFSVNRTEERDYLEQQMWLADIKK